MAAYAQNRAEGQVARLALIRDGKSVSVEISAAIAAWHVARLRPGAPWAVCACCGSGRFAPAEIIDTVALLIPVLSSTIEVAAICGACAALSDAMLIAELLARRGGREIDIASISIMAGRA